MLPPHQTRGDLCKQDQELATELKSPAPIAWLEKWESWLLGVITRTPLGQVTVITYFLIGLLGALLIAVKFGCALGTLLLFKKQLTVTSRQLNL